MPRPLRVLLLLVPALLVGCASGAPRGPVIDMHLHAIPVDPENARTITGLTRLPCATTNEQLFAETKRALDEHGVVLALVSGPHALAWQSDMPEVLLVGATQMDPLPLLRRRLANGQCKAIAEFAPQYRGIGPGDEALEPYFALAEEFDVPLGIHVGPGPPGAAYGPAPAYRMRLSNALALEEVLIRRPKLRVFVMHAGWPFLDEMIGLMWAHPQVYVELGVIDWAVPEAEFHHYLRRLVGAGFGDRIMFGSDQMDCPSAIDVAIRRILDADYLDARQKRAILYDNAARFLRLGDDAIAEHRAKVSG